MTRRLVAGGGATAAAVGAGALLLANGISGGSGGRGVLVVLYLVFLVATLSLLAGGLAWSEQAVDQMAAARVSSRRRRRLRTAAKRVGRRVGRRVGMAARDSVYFAARTSRDGAYFAARTSRAGARQLQAQLETALTPERRHAVLRALGLEDIDAPPAPKPYAAAHARRKAMATSAVTRRYNAFEARRGTRPRAARPASRS
jgi:hypothetical protein